MEKFKKLFKDNGFDCIHAQSRSDIPGSYKRDYREHVVGKYRITLIDQNDKQIVNTLRRYRIKYTILGAESDVDLAVKLATQFTPVLHHTGPYLRRNKLVVKQKLSAVIGEPSSAWLMHALSNI